MLDQEQKELYYKKRSCHGMRMPIKLDVWAMKSFTAMMQTEA